MKFVAAIKPRSRLIVFPLIVSFALTACSGHGSGADTPAPTAQVLLPNSFANLGPISGATVKVVDLKGAVIAQGLTHAYDPIIDTQVVGTTRQLVTYAKGRLVGRIEMSPSPDVTIAPTDLFIVSVSNGIDIDQNDNGVIADAEGSKGASLAGAITAVVSGVDLVKGGVHVNVLTMMASAGVQASADPVVVAARLNRLAAYIFKDKTAGDENGDGTVDYRDFYAYDPSVFTFAADGTGSRTNDSFLRNTVLIYGQLSKKATDGTDYLDLLHTSTDTATATQKFMVAQFGDVNNNGLANVFEDPATNDSDGDGMVDAKDDDIDGDGISNVIELRIGLNPWNKDSDGNGTTDDKEDSDGDGLTNGDEITKYKTDPGNADTDGDGIKDGDEVNHGLDPNDKTDATKDADSDGLTNIVEINTYKTDPQKADTDGDGLSDGDEVMVYKTDPLKKDTDGDGLNDGDEVNTYHTNPTLADTDGDGINDGDEINGFKLYDGTTVVHTDPLNVDTDGDGISDGIEKQVQDTFAKYPHPANAKDCLIGPLNPNNSTTKPNLGGLSFTTAGLTSADLEKDPDGDGKPTIEEICHGTNPNDGSNTFRYAYEGTNGAMLPEFVAMQAANFVYVPGGWDVDGDGTIDPGFFVAAYPAKDSGKAIPASPNVVDMLQGAQVYNTTKKTFVDRLCVHTTAGADTDMTDASGACRGNQYGNSGAATVASTSVNQVTFVTAGIPYANKSWIEARAALLASPIDAGASNGGPYSLDLPSDVQWMQLAQTAINNPLNWTSGTVGTGAVFRGHTDNAPAATLPVSNVMDPYSDTGNSSSTGADQKRVLIIANGVMTRDFSLPLTYSVQVWDLSGNVAEWTRSLVGAVSTTSTTSGRSGGDRFANGLSGIFDFDGTSLSGSTQTITASPAWLKPTQGTITVLKHTLGVGVYNDGPSASDSDGDGQSNGGYCTFDAGYGASGYVDHFSASLRGGDFTSASNGGVAGLDLQNGICRRLSAVGFRATH